MFVRQVRYSLLRLPAQHARRLGACASDMADYNEERESEVDPDEAVRAEIRGPAAREGPQRVEMSKRTLTKFEEADITDSARTPDSGCQVILSWLPP